MTDTTHNGKIGRLPKKIRDELNHRLDDGELGGRILEWLNELPDVQAVLKAEFGGSRINEQNLTNWRKGGFQHWLKQQERSVTVQQLTEDSKELNADADGVEIANHLSAVLVAELVASARDALANITDPAERCVRVQEFLQTLARVRRQDNLAGRLAIERERRARERVKEKEKDDRRRENAPFCHQMHRITQRSMMAILYESPNLASQALANEEAESLLRDVKLDGSRPDGPTAPLNPESN
jgi:hypothetical protein